MAQASVMSSLQNIRIAKQGDIILAIGVLVILVVMLIPLPTFFLDLMLSFSITLSLLVLLSSLFILSPLELSVFPTLLLVATMLRLALNVASTRLILLYGNTGANAAGSVIASFGEFVVGGSYIVGAIIFLILFILNKVVIAAGTTRIAEVAARFTLDAMPGKQMAIEADLNAGIIDEKEATRRRENIRKEADFYGAMDGAGKFVQGDVTAGLIITIINLVGGICIGMVSYKMSWQDAASTYTLLTIGDGLVSTIPSIILSTSAGIIVSRAAGANRIGEELIKQLTHNIKSLRIIAGLLFFLAIIPGMPKIPFFIFSILFFVASRVMGSRQSGATDIQESGVVALKDGFQKNREEETLETPESVQALLPLNTLELEVGYGLIPLVDEKQDGTLLQRIRSIRKQIALEMGVIVPSLHLRDNLQLRSGEYCVLVKGNQVADAEIMLDYLLAMNSGKVKDPISGIETVDPAFKIPAVWIQKSAREDAVARGYTVVDATTVITTHLTEICKRNLAEFLGRQEVQTLLDNLAKRAPKAVEELVPGILSLGIVQKVLQNLVNERISIRDLLTIVETLADYGGQIKNPDILTEYVRERLALTIVRPHINSEGLLSVFSLDHNAEKILQDSLRHNEATTYLALQPILAQNLIQNIKNAVDNTVVADKEPVVVVSSLVRPHLAKLIHRFLPDITIVSQAEIPSQIRVQTLGSISIQ